MSKKRVTTEALCLYLLKKKKKSNKQNEEQDPDNLTTMKVTVFSQELLI